MRTLFEHLRLAEPWWLTLLIPFLFLLLLRRGKGAAAAISFPNVPILAALGGKVRQGAWNFGLPLAWLALATSVIALARPVWRNEYQSRSASGIDIVIAFDLSLSMEIDDFVSEEGRPLQRIDAAKSVVKDFITGRPDDRMGLVVFAGKPYKVSPITLDHQWLLNGLSDLHLGGPNDPRGRIGTIEEQGTAIGSALAASALRLDARDAKSKVIILVTDGANNSGKIAPLEAAEHAKTLGIKIYTVAIGTPEGRVAGNVQRFPRQEFDLPTLQKIAEMTGGGHYYAQTFSKLKDYFKDIDRLEKTEAKSLTVIDDTELFPWFVGAAALFAFVAALALSFNPPLSS
ncbi:VWA domain-containing protein [Luteolibacter ambystomatis]|uniref:VWA domain-containing protein n=1 Tax=Luteolibacter ambystomatis TaxID=2824561 RepID=A0A975PF49_9BACT|nr:VWA domain-containing protein [Luteolibacter ambystomatis]QUE51700.1 VWA domain-containing protein [Luteolibacter ambystomatis]